MVQFLVPLGALKKNVPDLKIIFCWKDVVYVYKKFNNKKIRVVTVQYMINAI